MAESVTLSDPYVQKIVLKSAESLTLSNLGLLLGIGSAYSGLGEQRICSLPNDQGQNLSPKLVRRD
jgi:hypothetical protein